jgi:molybdopterin-guanine dinucleotide biosynthesis protein A
MVTGGDMPDLVAEVAESLLAALDATGMEAAVLEHAGQPQPLPMAIRRDPARAAAARLIQTGQRRLRALTDALATAVIAEATWRKLDPDGRTIHDIDTPADLL